MMQTRYYRRVSKLAHLDFILCIIYSRGFGLNVLCTKVRNLSDKESRTVNHFFAPLQKFKMGNYRSPMARRLSSFR